MSRSSNRKRLTSAEREKLKQMYGTKCYMCGSEDDIEWHHIKPLWMGGEDTLENMMPVCYVCHKVVTSRIPFEVKRKGSHKKIGRPRKIPKDYEAILDRYMRCEFGTRKCVELLKLSKGSHLSDNVWYKEYLQKRGIKSFRNNVDMRLAKGAIAKGDPAGKIVYLDDGRTEMVYAPHDILPSKTSQIEFNFNTGSEPTGANEYRGSKRRTPKAKPVKRFKDIYDVDADWWKEYRQSYNE